MGMIKFNGASSKDFGVEVETFPNYVAPQKEYEAIHIPGRNGDLLIDSGTYSNVEKRYKVNMVKEPPATEVSGPIANFKSNVSLPLSELKTNINPVQDLHGYSKPWSGGGGKNKLDYLSNLRASSSGLTISATSGGAIHYQGTATVNYCQLTYIFNMSIPSGTTVTVSRDVAVGHQHYFNFTFTDNSVEYVRIMPNTTSTTYTLPKDLKSIDIVCLGLAVGTAYNETVKFQLEYGSQATSWEPYENICPISGFSALNVTRTGKNLFKKGVSTSANGVTFTVNDDGSISLSGTATNTAFFIAFENMEMPYGTYTLSGGYSALIAIYIRGSSSGANILGSTGSPSSGVINTGVITGLIRIQSGTNTDGITLKPQLEVGNQASTYEPYNGQTATVNFGQTVYGGVLDVTNGKLKITHNFVDLGDLAWSKQTSVGGTKTYFRTASEFADCKKNTNVGQLQGLICSNYAEDTWSHTVDTVGYDSTICTGWTNKSYIAINDQSKVSMSADDFKTAMSGVTLVYELATPIEIDTTPENLTAIVGDNNIFSDTGDVDIKTNELATTYSGKMELIANWLNSASGYARLEDSYDPDYYRLAYFNQALDIENLYDEAGRVTLSFICKPQKFYKSGEDPVVFTSAGKIQNRTQHTALPLLKVKTDNTDGTVSIGNSSFGISAGSGTDIIIDCELQNAYYGIENKNNYIVLNDGDFPRIEPGTQVVSFTGGVQSVEVIPRWWTV